MAISSFPNGFAEGVLIRGVPIFQSYPGKIFWVGNSAAVAMQGEAGASDSNKGTFLSPFSTIDFAIGRCAANRGDIIVVRPGHVTTVTAASGVLMDVAGVALIGIGTGSNRPTMNFTTVVGASCFITAPNCTIMNFLFTGGIDALTGVIVTNVTADDFALLGCEYRDVTGQATDVIRLVSANRALIDNWRHDGASAAGSNSAISMDSVDGAILRNLNIEGNFAVSAIDFRTTLSTDVRISDSMFRQRGTGLVVSDTVTGTTGLIGPNLYAHITNSATGNMLSSFTAATCQFFDPIFVVNSDATNLRGLQLAKGVASDA